MRKFLFIEYNQPGMEWMTPEESPSITEVEAPTPEAALEDWVENHARFWTLEHAEAEADSDNWGVDVRMFEIRGEYTALPLKWLKRIQDASR